MIELATSNFLRTLQGRNIKKNELKPVLRIRSNFFRIRIRFLNSNLDPDLTYVDITN